jgi:peptidoglycan/LPS O-acetylase OafA/YrhL
VPAWTLAVDMTFYVLLAGIVLLMRRYWRATRIPAARWRGEFALPFVFFSVGTIPWIVALSDPGLAFLTTTLAGTLGWFAAGMGLAVLSVRAEHGLALPAPMRAARDHPALCWTAAAGVVAWIATTGLFPTPDHITTTLSPLESTLVVFAGVAAGMLFSAPVLLGAKPSGRILRILSSRPLVWAGLTGYGTYLIHIPLIILLVGAWDGIDAVLPKTLVALAIVYPLAVAVGGLSWYFVERPLIRAAGRALRNRRVRRSEIGPGTPVRSPA